MNHARRMIGPIMLVVLLGLAAGCSLFNRPPIASFDVIYNVTEDPLVVDLDATSSSDPDGDEITDYMWDFGEDATILTPLEFTKLVTIPILRVRYPTEGQYTITLVVRDARGTASETAAQETIVLPNPQVEPSL